MSEEELKKEMEVMYEVMYAQFKMMCKMSGIPAPPPELMKAMMAGSVKDAMGDSDDVDPQVKEQMENVMKDFGGRRRDDEVSFWTQIRLDSIEREGLP